MQMQTATAQPAPVAAVMVKVEDGHVDRSAYRCCNVFCDYKIGSDAEMGGFCCKMCAQVFDFTGGDLDLVESWRGDLHGPRCQKMPAPDDTPRAAIGLKFHVPEIAKRRKHWKNWGSGRDRWSPSAS